MRIVSFSLYGDNPLYLHGALMNARTIKRWYPGWACRFYVGASVPRDVYEQLVAEGAKVIHVDAPESHLATLWRFRPVCEEGVDAVVIRDCDSRFGKREQDAVDEWLAQGSPFHIMRDHPAHKVPILGGMWGATGTGLTVVREAIIQNIPPDLYGADQYFLAKHIYPLIKRQACIHDAYFCYELRSKHFSSQREDYGFVGEVINTAEEPNPEQRDEVRMADNFLKYRLRLKAGSLKDMLLKRGYWGASL
jgi:hypothetical protein